MFIELDKNDAALPIMGNWEYLSLSGNIDVPSNIMRGVSNGLRLFLVIDDMEMIRAYTMIKMVDVRVGKVMTHMCLTESDCIELLQGITTEGGMTRITAYVNGDFDEEFKSIGFTMLTNDEEVNKVVWEEKA